MQRGKLGAELDARARQGLNAALDAGAAVLSGQGTALDAVEQAARVLEEDPCFNAGRGSVLAFDGHVELDAAIMDGRDRRCGAVAGLRSTRAPVSAARAVMEKSPHVLMSHEGADDFACEAGVLKRSCSPYSPLANFTGPGPNSTKKRVFACLL